MVLAPPRAASSVTGPGASTMEGRGGPWCHCRMTRHPRLPEDPANPAVAGSRERRPWLQGIAGAGLFLLTQTLLVVVARGGERLLPSVMPRPMALLTTSLLVSATCVIMVVAGYRLIVRRIGCREAPEMDGPGALRELAAGLALGGALICAVFAVLALAGAYRVTGVGWSEGIAVGLVFGVVGGSNEETMFRGFLQRLIETRLGSWWALGIISVVFGLLHLSNPQATLSGCLIIALTAAPLLGVCYLLTRRLWLAIGVHAAWNFVQGGVFGSDVSGTGMIRRGLFEAAFHGPDWLTGGDMGVEGSVVTVVVCVTAAAVILLAARRRGMLLPPRWRRPEPAGDDDGGRQ